MADNIVYPRLSQSIWDRLPMEMSAVLPWLAMTAAYLLVFGSAIGLFLWLKRCMTVKISNQIKERIYKRYVENKDSVYTQKSILSTLNNDIPQLETEYYQAILSFITCIAEAILALAVTFSKNIYYGAFCFIFMMIPVLLTKKRVAAISSMTYTLVEAISEWTKFSSIRCMKNDIFEKYDVHVKSFIQSGR